MDLASPLNLGSLSPSPSCDESRDASPPGPAMAFSPSPPRAHFVPAVSTDPARHTARPKLNWP